MKRFINGKLHEITSNADGSFSADVIRESAGIPPDRIMIIQKPDGSNQVINPGDKTNIHPEDHVADMALHKRGQYHESKSGCTA